jgi:hypothetical protein
MPSYLNRIADLCGDPEMKTFSPSRIASAYEYASLRYTSVENRCYSAAAELLTSDLQRLIERYEIKSEGDGVEKTEMQSLTAIIQARKSMISQYQNSIVTESVQGSARSFGYKFKKTTIRGIND